MAEIRDRRKQRRTGEEEKEEGRERRNQFIDDCDKLSGMRYLFSDDNCTSNSTSAGLRRSLTILSKITAS